MLVRKLMLINGPYVQIGNAWIDDNLCTKGMFDFFWTHALNSDETNAGVNKYCDFATGKPSTSCDQYQSQGFREIGQLDIYNIYAPLCKSSAPAPPSAGTVSVLINFMLVITSFF